MTMAKLPFMVGLIWSLGRETINTRESKVSKFVGEALQRFHVRLLPEHAGASIAQWGN
jgi:hypothetical protein